MAGAMAHISEEEDLSAEEVDSDDLGEDISMPKQPQQMLQQSSVQPQQMMFAGPQPQNSAQTPPANKHILKSKTIVSKKQLKPPQKLTHPP